MGNVGPDKTKRHNIMNDPHVNALIYEVITDKDVDYDKAMPFFEECADFTLSIDGQKAAFRMERHFATEEEARKLVDNFLQAWSISIGLEYTPDEIKFVFESAEIIDRNPPKETCNSKSINMCCFASGHSSGSAAIHISKGKFPSPPQNFVVTPNVETMYIHYKAYRDNREPLTAMANMCRTVLETSAGGRRYVPRRYFVHLEVIRKLGDLVSTRGSELEARKMPKNGTFVPLTQKEKSWIEEVIKRIIFRVGEHAFDPQKQLPEITMSDFPTLDKN
jgi:hypothetical protein